MQIEDSTVLIYLCILLTTPVVPAYYCTVAVRMDGERESEGVALGFVTKLKYGENLAPDVTLIHLEAGAQRGPHLGLERFDARRGNPLHVLPGLRSRPSSEVCADHPPVDLSALDRFMPMVDRVSYQTRTDTGPAATRTAVFKYYWHEQFMEQQWDELNLLVRLLKHPNIAPFDRIVLDEVWDRRGGLHVPLHPRRRPPRRRVPALRVQVGGAAQQVVDDLNMRYDIVHQVSSLAACWSTKPRTTSCCTSSTRLRRLVVLADPSFWTTEVSN